MLKDIFYVIKTGDGKAKAFYIMVLVVWVLSIIGFVAGAIGVGYGLIKQGTASAISIGAAVASLVIFIGVLIWMNKLRSL